VTYFRSTRTVCGSFTGALAQRNPGIQESTMSFEAFFRRIGLIAPHRPTEPPSWYEQYHGLASYFAD
jgi:hypothetical protein